jgi:pimeloyl-ACP methyl ester carboxylesterase
VLLHGYPKSFYMWRGALSALQEAGWHAIAPDLAGFGDSEPDRRALGSATSRQSSAFGANWASSAACSLCTTGAA